MSKEIVRKIELDRFSNTLGLEMGLEIVKLAKARKKSVAVQIERLNHAIFTYFDDDVTADKHHWIRRKANVAKHFEESTFAVKHDLINGNMTLKGTFALDDADYVASGGSIPIFVKNAGMVAVVTVSGLPDEEDHNLILDALQGKYF